MRKKLALLFTMLTLFTVACGNADNTTPKTDVAITDLAEAMLAADTTLPEMVTVSSTEDQAELNFTYLSELSYDLVDSYFYAYAKDGTAAELAVVKLKDQRDAAAMMDALHSHVEQRKGTFQEYAPEQVTIAEQAVITREGCYVAMIICEKNGMVQNAFRSFF